jgi:hypothetical protein
MQAGVKARTLIYQIREKVDSCNTLNENEVEVDRLLPTHVRAC